MLSLKVWWKISNLGLVKDVSPTTLERSRDSFERRRERYAWQLCQVEFKPSAYIDGKSKETVHFGMSSELSPDEWRSHRISGMSGAVEALRLPRCFKPFQSISNSRAAPQHDETNPAVGTQLRAIKQHVDHKTGEKGMEESSPFSAGFQRLLKMWYPYVGA